MWQAVGSGTGGTGYVWFELVSFEEEKFLLHNLIFCNSFTCLTFQFGPLLPVLICLLVNGNLSLQPLSVLCHAWFSHKSYMVFLCKICSTYVFFGGFTHVWFTYLLIDYIKVYLLWLALMVIFVGFCHIWVTYERITYLKKKNYVWLTYLY